MVPRTVNGTFTPNGLELQLFFDALGNRDQDPYCAAFGLQIDIAVIGKATVTMSAAFQFRVEIVEQNFRQQRGERPALRGSFLPDRNNPTFKKTRLQGATNNP